MKRSDSLEAKGWSQAPARCGVAGLMCLGPTLRQGSLGDSISQSDLNVFGDGGDGAANASWRCIVVAAAAAAAVVAVVDVEGELGWEPWFCSLTYLAHEARALKCIPLANGIES